MCIKLRGLKRFLNSRLIPITPDTIYRVILASEWHAMIEMKLNARVLNLEMDSDCSSSR